MYMPWMFAASSSILSNRLFSIVIFPLQLTKWVASAEVVTILGEPS